MKPKRLRAVKPLAKQKSGRVNLPASVRKVEADDVLYFAVLYTKRSRKKNKVFQDGFISLRNDKVLTLLDEAGGKVAQSSSRSALGGLKEGNTLELNSFELEIDHVIPAEEFLTGRMFLSTTNIPIDVVSKSEPSYERNPATAAASSGAVSRAFRPPRTLSGIVAPAVPRVAKPLHDPLCPNAIVLQSSYVRHCGRRSLAIVLDPYLGRHMRPHQKEGVKFLYQCVEGKNLKRDSPQGAILGDEMGLGKSLQSIALIWTLLKQGPFGFPVAEKAIIVCPASLVGNWAAEIKKWLGDERLQPIQVQSGQSKSFQGFEIIQDFVNGKVKRALIISYDMFRSFAEELYKCSCGILVCDEGHRLKSSSGNKTIEALVRMPCRRRIILTGTPVQNNLSEFYAMCNFVIPGVFGDFQRFRLVFACPIEKSRDTYADASVLALGEERAAELQRVASRFVLRRTSKMLESYLPPKTEIVVFCRLSSQQETAYEELCSSLLISLKEAEAKAPLPLINSLRKICCHPSMVLNTPYCLARARSGKNGMRSIDNDILSSARCSSTFDTAYEPSAGVSLDIADSGKIRVGLSLITAAVAVGDRVVLVSNYTANLDLIQALLESDHLSYLRLDGSTPSNRRSDIVMQFNGNPRGASVFLLSAKAGGVGLNLIGANRLILFDPDWNPATDLQTMARVWRDGQEKAVFVYRLICTGTIEEKIYQRQLFKRELQVAVGAVSSGLTPHRGTSSKPPKSGVGNGSNFTAEELKDLFTYGKGLAYCDTLRALETSRKSEDDQTTVPALLNDFGAYRKVLETSHSRTLAEGVADLGPDMFMPCSFDDVLSYVLNESDSSRGVVSYLYTVETGQPGFHLLQSDRAENHRPSEEGHESTECGNVPSADGSKDFEYVDDSDDHFSYSNDTAGRKEVCDRGPPQATVRQRHHPLAVADEVLPSKLSHGDRLADTENIEDDAPASTLWSGALGDLDGPA